MVTVWNKLTSQISTWFGDDNKKCSRGGGKKLRSSCSMSTLNQKHLRVKVRSSRSTEHLNRIIQQPLVNAQQPTVSSAQTTFLMKAKLSVQRQHPNVDCVDSEAGPWFQDKQHHQQHEESGYGSTGYSGSPSRKKNSGASSIFSAGRFRNAKKSSAPHKKSSSSLNNQPQSSSSGGSSSRQAPPRQSQRQNCTNFTEQRSVESVGKQSSILAENLSPPPNELDSGIMHPSLDAEQHQSGASSNCRNAPARSSQPSQSQLYHTLPMSLSWSSHLCDSTRFPSGNAQNGHFAMAAQQDEQREQSVASSSSKSSTGTAAGRWVNALLSSGRARLAAARRPKRSRSVGATTNIRVSTTMAAIGPTAKEETPSATAMKRAPTFGYPNNGFRTPQSASFSKCKQSIDANFLALAQKEHPVLNSDSMFRRLEKLGEGSYATVIKSENRLDGSIVALKEIKLQPQEGLPFTAIREISLLRALKHANIVRLYQIIHQTHSLILVFEYMKTDLSKLMEKFRGGLDPFRTKIFLFQLLRGLAFCHERKILHRDLKPQNLLVSEDGELKLADFGLARAKSVPCRTFSHDVVTLWYRPPDVLLGSTQYSTSLDMWGVGCIFAEMCSGTALFPGVNDVFDQLDRIFGIRGVPDPDAWPQVQDLPNYSIFQFAPYVELPWNKVDVQLARMDCKGRELLNKFLQLNPRDRISADQAMLHDYFSDLPPALHSLDSTDSVFSVLNRSRFV